MLSNAQERALGVLELLDSILRLLTPRDLASCAGVCRYWEMPSLQILWKNGAGEHVNLLKILGDLEVSDGPIVGVPISSAIRIASKIY